MFPSIASASHSSSGIFGQGTQMGDSFASNTFGGGTVFGGTSTSSFCHTSPSSSSYSGFGSSTSSMTASGFAPFGFSSSALVNGPQPTKLTFNLEQSHFCGQERGSRIAVYKKTADAASSKEKLVSISAMPAYKAKSHEELRWEDYNFTRKGGFGLSSSAIRSTSPTTNFSSASWRTTSFSSTTVKPNPFDKTFPSIATGTTTWNYPGPTSTSFTSQPLQFPTSANTCLTTVTTAPSSSFNPFIPFTQKNPFTTSTNLAFPASTTVSAAPLNFFNSSVPGTTLTSSASTASSVSLAPLNYNPFTNSSNSLATHTSSSCPTSSSTTWNYPGPTSTSFTSQPLQFPTSANTCLTTVTSAPSSSFNPFNTFIPFTQKNPFTPSTNLTFPAFTTVSAAPLTLFNSSVPGTTLTSAASTASSVSLAPLNYNPFTNSSNSLATHTSSSCPMSTSLNAFWSTPIRGPFISTATAAAAANSILVSPVSSGLSSTFKQPTALFNSCAPPAQNFNGTTTGIIGQSSVSQPSLSQMTSTGKPSSPESPFGTLPQSPRMFFDGSQSIQYGISSIPVKDKPAPVKYSLLTTRHLSGRIKLPVRKYDPKLNAPKKPYFSDTKEIPVAAYVPRENPRALVVCPEKWPPRAMMENFHEEKISVDIRDDPTKVKKLFTTLLDVPSKLQQPDYYTQPQISELEAKERAEPGFCRRVKDFVIGRHGYGSIKFLGETDVTKVDIETHVQFNNREVIVYMDDSMKPAVGEGLNKPAEITLLNIKCIDKKTGMQYVDGPKINKCREMLKKKAAAQGAEFMSYDPVEGEWKFRVQHF
ncbi:hypothetical protein L1987_77989 [Smallanthus sonchifolius]|uniref:Uncharacterized protein n=1 Tax=Smallanthus sonchifolius TaxID=185202 RepID=A0ACB8ZAI0_9ASTR|nr:hypothetical protein L1987_77989 [Smallanthus sonchifolius]